MILILRVKSFAINPNDSGCPLPVQVPPSILKTKRGQAGTTSDESAKLDEETLRKVEALDAQLCGYNYKKQIMDS